MTPRLSAARGSASAATASGSGPAVKKRYFDVPATDWLWDIIFMLSLAITGLAMPLGNLLVIILLVREYTVNREGFVLKLMLVLGGFAMTKFNTQWGINLTFLTILGSMAAMVVLKKPPVIKKAIIFYALFALLTAFICFRYGVLGFRGQIRLLLNYLTFCFFAVPLVCFSGENFDIRRFWQKLFSLSMIMCAFYIIDGFVLRGWFLVPCSWIDFNDSVSTLFHPIIHGPGGSIVRKYQPGLYLLLLLAYPMAREYKLRWWQWLLILGAFGACRSIAFIVSFFIGLVIAQGKGKKYIFYTLGVIVFFALLYVVDDSMGYSETGGSTMRIASSVNQFADLSVAEDDEDLADMGTGRMGQALPALEYLYDEGRQWTGFGFVPVETEHPYLIVYNEFAEDIDFRYRSVTNVEISLVQQLLTMGYLGIIVWTAFIAAIWMLIRRMKYAGMFMNVTITMYITGFSMIDLWLSVQGNLLGAVAFAAVLLANRPGNSDTDPDSLPESPDSLPESSAASHLAAPAESES